MVLTAGVPVVTAEGRGYVLAASPARVLVFVRGHVVEITGGACADLAATTP